MYDIKMSDAIEFIASWESKFTLFGQFMVLQIDYDLIKRKNQ